MDYKPDEQGLYGLSTLQSTGFHVILLAGFFRVPNFSHICIVIAIDIFRADSCFFPQTTLFVWQVFLNHNVV
jgi:hypothetical protein